jgi:hypothetical protein
MFAVEGGLSRTNQATNPFFLVDPFKTTTHERPNNLPLVWIVLWASLGYEEGLETEEWSSICNFILSIHVMWSSRGFDAKMLSYTRLQTTETQQPHLERIPSK